jgi:hypothetical protein
VQARVDSEPEDGLDGAQEYVWRTNVNVPDVSRAIHRFLSNYRSSSDDVDAKYVQLIEHVGGLCPILSILLEACFSLARFIMNLICLGFFS